VRNTALARLTGRTGFMVAALVAWSLTAAAQTPAPAPGTQKPGMAPRPPLLFSETFRIPPHTGEETDENTRVTQAVVTNPNLEIKLYGADASVIRAATHEQRTDLWNGMTTSPAAVTLRDKRSLLDLTGAARLRWILRTTRFTRCIRW